MDKRMRRYFRFGIVVALVIASLFLLLDYANHGSVSFSTIMFVSIGTIVGVVGSYVMYLSFFEREREMVFMPGEEVILQRKYPEKSVVIPQKIGRGDSTEMAPAEVNLYLTNIGLAAEPPGTGEPILYIPYGDIEEMQTVNRMLLKYVRVRYLDVTGVPAEVLIYAGKDTSMWAEKIGRMLVG